MILACSFLFFSFLPVLSAFDIRVIVASYNEFGSLPSSSIFWKSLSRIGANSFLNFWYNSPVKPSGLGLLFAGRFLITVSISVLVIGLLRFLFLPGSVLEGCTFLGIRPFLPSCPFYWHIVADSSLLDPLYFCVVCRDFSIFILNFVDLILFLFFLDESG